MNYKNRIFKISFLFFLAFSFLFSHVSLAAEGDTCICVSGATIPGCFDCELNCQGFGSTMKECKSASVQGATGGTNSNTADKLPNPLGTDDINVMIGRAINFVLGLVGSVSLLMFIYGGMTWMTSAGAQEKIKKGREIIVWSVIGLAVVFSSYILVKFVITSLAA